MALAQNIPNASYIFLLFVGMFFSGFWVRRSGQPYPFLTFNVHKFIGLGLGALLIKMVYDRHQSLTLEVEQIVPLVVTVMFFALTVIAGGLLSVQSEGGLSIFPPTLWRAISYIHKFSPYLILLSTAFTLYRIFS